MVDESSLFDAHGVEKLISRVTAMATSKDDIRAVAIVGSLARTDHPADRWADIDFLFYVRRPEDYLNHDDWLPQLGDVHARWYKDAIAGQPELLTIFAGGVDADFVFGDVGRIRATLRAQSLLKRFPLLEPMLPKKMAAEIRTRAAIGSQIFGRGVRVLCDKENIFSRLQAMLGPPPSWSMPTAREFAATVSEFWCLAEKTCRKIRRGELFVALQWLHYLHTSSLLRMIEWQARIVRGARDTWHLGRFIEEWADPRAITALHDAFPHYTDVEVRRSLLVTLELFEWLSAEVASALSMTDALVSGKKVAPWIRTCVA